MRKKQQVQTTGEALEKPESQIRVMWDTLKKNKAAVAGLVVILFFLFLAVMGDWLAPYDPEYSDMGHTFVAPCRDYYFGTDQLGRDIFSRVLSGTKISLFVGVAGVGLFPADRDRAWLSGRLFRREGGLLYHEMYGHHALNSIHSSGHHLDGSPWQRT